MKLNAAIIVLVGRPKLFKKTIDLFYRNWNSAYQYPIYVHTLGEKFSEDDKNFFIRKYQNIYFENLNPKIPKNIREKDIFYNRLYNSYVYQSFGPQRLGYLHAIYFGTNISSFGKNGCISKKLEKYDYIMRIDDDGWFRKKIKFDLFRKFKNYPMATGKLSIDKSHAIQLVREKLFFFLKKYIKKNNILVVNKKLKWILKSGNEKNLSLIHYSLGNFDLYNMKVFKSKKFKNFLNSLNNFGGIYKYRWGDYEIINLFLYMFYEKPIMNFNFSDSVYKSAHPDTKQVNDQINFCSRLLFFVMRRLRRLFNY
jgi:hypothetical protein